jgi:glycosyltransferase involved in cell wall biosynthesis
VVELVYTVNGEFEREYEAKVKAKVKKLGLEDQFIFTGPLNDEAKWEAYRRADLFVLPTYSENFGIVVAEALWAGVPVITTKGTPWSDLEGDANLTTNDSQLTTRCGWWIDLPAEGSNPSNWDALDGALVSAMSMSDKERGEMGERGRKLVEEKYTWDAVCSAMVDGYEKVLGDRG